MTHLFALAKKRAPWAPVAALCALMLSSCLTIPLPSPRSALVDLPSVEKSLEQAMGRGAVKTGDWPHEKWWESFGDDTLNSLVERAITDSPDMRIAAARERLAEQVARAAGAATSFSLSVGGNAAVHRMSENSWIPAEFLEIPYTSAELSANLGYDLDLWGVSRLAAEGKIDAQKAAQAQIHSARLTLSLAVTRAYLQWQNIRRLADIAGAAVVARQLSREMIRQKERRGMETELNVERAKYSVTLITGALFALRGAEAMERNRLAALIGAGPDRGMVMAEPPGHIRLPA
ncbi:MAG: TolC family protein, partial [Nitrospinota bacterium]|nr:TolC family protein [Nitrospinota bacterium]